MSYFGKKFTKPYKKASSSSKFKYVDENKSKYFNVRLSKKEMDLVYDSLKCAESIGVEEYCSALDYGNVRRANYLRTQLKQNDVVKNKMMKYLLNKKQFYVKK